MEPIVFDSRFQKLDENKYQFLIPPQMVPVEFTVGETTELGTYVEHRINGKLQLTGYYWDLSDLLSQFNINS